MGRNLLDVGNLITQDQTLQPPCDLEGSMYGYWQWTNITVCASCNAVRIGKVKSVRTTASRLKLGTANEIDRYPHEGELDFVNNRLDAGTGTIQLRGEFPNPKINGGPPYLSAGVLICVHAGRRKRGCFWSRRRPSAPTRARSLYWWSTTRMLSNIAPCYWAQPKGNCR